MAPFGRNFLKARSKSRSEGKEPVPGKEIQVWVWQEEKIVCGITKHTTCVDVVQALLEDHRSSPENRRVPLDEPTEYCLLERWKGFERALPPLTRILRLWNAWGDQRRFVQFILVKTGECGNLSGNVSPRPNGALSKSESRSMRWEQGPTQYVRSLPVDRQKRMVRKAFRKLEKIRDREGACPGDEGGIGGLVQLIIAQDHTIRQQIHRVTELDLEIERIEQGLGADGESAGAERSDSIHSTDAECVGTAGRLQDDPHRSDGINPLDVQLERHRDLIDRLSRDIDAEIRNAWSEPQGASAAPGPEDFLDTAELERVRRDLERSMLGGLTLHAQLADLQDELERNHAVLRSKSQECEQLAEQLGALRVADCASRTEQGGHVIPRDQPRSGDSGCSSAQSKLCQVLSQGVGSDTDSDTGISSTHSQDSLSPCGDLRPSLETDV